MRRRGFASLVLAVTVTWLPAPGRAQSASPAAIPVVASSATSATTTPEHAAAMGCLSCHEGIEVINQKMQPVLLALADNKNGFECVICHEGRADATNIAEAHTGMYPNPSSMWVMNDGKGCAKCHSDKDALKTRMGKPKDKPAGGSIMSFVSTISDPSGASGGNHV